ncbi:hypothetical protein [Clostridium sp. AWRP]|nr:hypothetical protein [Clostridium sp. AWRP]
MKLEKAFLEIMEEDSKDMKKVELDECTNKINTLEDNIKAFTSEATLLI